jgi:hypothetical protein
MKVLLPEHQNSRRKIIYTDNGTVRQRNQIWEHEKRLHQDGAKEFEERRDIIKAENLCQNFGKNQRSRLFLQ